MTRLFDTGQTLIEVRGDEAREWLNGQLTCDVRQLPEGGSMRGLRLGKNGRIQALVHMLDRAEGVDLTVPRASAEALAEELDRYIIMEDVEIHPRLDRHVLAVCTEAELEGSVSGFMYELPVRLLVVSDVAGALEKLGASLVSADEVEWLRVAAGEPGAAEVGRGLLPQEAGLKDLVSFTKGCYLGQEPVVMLEHRGRAPKRLARLGVHAPVAPSTSVTLESGESVGEITSAASRAGEHLALALLKRRAMEADALFVDGAPVVARAWLGER